MAWKKIKRRYEKETVQGNNHFKVNETFSILREMEIEILMQITAQRSLFPLENPQDWAGLWELWQHYYFQAYYLGQHFEVARYSIYNEPNHANADGLKPADGLLRLRFSSDAIQCALADVNRDFGKKLAAKIYAPTTAGSPEGKAFEKWGRPALAERHLRIDGTTDENWRNFHVYSYQSYSLSARKYAGDVAALREKMMRSAGVVLPLALTEFNVRTGSNFDKVSATLDRPSHAAALGMNCIDLATAGVADLYLFKFGMTETGRSYHRYPVQKNGVHFVDNEGHDGLYQYGGITAAGEVWRLFNAVAKPGRKRLRLEPDPELPGLSALATAGGGNLEMLLANRGKKAAALDLDLTRLGLPEGSGIIVSEVSTTCFGGVRHVGVLKNGRLALADGEKPQIPPETVWRVRVLPALGGGTDTLPVHADAELRDGKFRRKNFGFVKNMSVRNGTEKASGRRVAMLEFDLRNLRPGDVAGGLLALNVSKSGSGKLAQAYLYGAEAAGIAEGDWTWAACDSLRQNRPAGPLIRNNFVLADGKRVRILGQLVVTEKDEQVKYLDVGAFLKEHAGKKVTFYLAQESRWDQDLYDKEPGQVRSASGDVQEAGLGTATRESGRGGKLLVWARVRHQNKRK